MYDNGQGVPQDYAKAAEWFREAAEQGHLNARFNLALMYGDGQGVPKDYAADQGYAKAQNNLGVVYANGQGVTQDYVQAHMWFNLAAAQGIEVARENRDILAKKMTPADISKAQAMAREWLEKHQE